MNTNLNGNGQSEVGARSIGNAPVRIPVRFPSQPATCHRAFGTSQPATCNVKPSTRVTLSNDSGFWQLTFHGQTAVVKQHPGLFFVAWLMENAQAQPLDASALASGVYANYCEHPDFFILLGWLCRQQSQTDMAQILVKKERALEAILDRPPIIDRAAELDPVKAEALAELELLYEFQASYFAELTPATADTTARRMMADLLSLHTTLTLAVDAQGNPHPIARAFALHILVYILMPSIRATARTGHTCFIYDPSVLSI